MEHIKIINEIERMFATMTAQLREIEAAQVDMQGMITVINVQRIVIISKMLQKKPSSAQQQKMCDILHRRIITDDSPLARFVTNSDLIFHVRNSVIYPYTYN